MSAREEHWGALPQPVKSALWEGALTACPDCGLRGVPQSWAHITHDVMQARIASLEAELDGLRVRTLTAEQDADRLATAVRVQLECGCPDCAVMAIDADDEHETALRARVAGETGDTP